MDCLDCPYLSKGKVRSLCSAYIGREMIPSVFEEENYCSSQSHQSCVWFRANAREDIEQHKVAGSDLPDNGVRPLRLLTATEAM